MKKLDRLSPPECFNNQIESVKNKKAKFYEDLRDSKGEIRPRWNTICLNTNKKTSQIKQTLLGMSNYCCAYCGKKIAENELDVEHYLPKEEFEYLSYCWENYLPSCKACNQDRKKSFCPNSLKSKKIIESIMVGKTDYDLVYDTNKQTILNATSDRIIEPTLDNPDDHLEFDTEQFRYFPKTEIGEYTNQLFFDHYEVAKFYEELSELMKGFVKDQTSSETLNLFLQAFGYEYVCLQFYSYWTKEKEAGRINR